MLLQVHTRLVVTQINIEKMFNKIIEIGFQSAVFHLCQRALVPLLRNERGPNATASILGSILSLIRCYEGVKITRLLSFSN